MKEKHNKSRSRSRSHSNDIKQAEELSLTYKIRQKIIQKELGYTNEENPFGDRNINETILWGKSKQKTQNLKTESEIFQDIQKVKQNRLQRQQDKQRLEEERQNQIKEREYETYMQWKQKEESFHKFQSKIRALVRITQGKEEFVDKISKIYYIYKQKIAFNPHLEPLMMDLISQIKIQETTILQKLHELSKNCQLEEDFPAENELENLNQFWVNMQHVTYFFLEEKHKQFEEFQNEIQSIFINKKLPELSELEKTINSTLKNPSLDKTDQLYWQNVQDRLLLYKASLIFQALYNQFFSQTTSFSPEQSHSDSKNAFKELKPQENEVVILPEHACSPILIPFGDQREKLAIQIEKIEDIREIFFNKIYKKALNALESKKVKNSHFVIEKQTEKEEVDQVTQKLLEIEKKKPMEEGEEAFDEQFQVQNNYDWQDQCKSKKPKFFNRVKWGFDWNKYNQMHFDTDNTPPKYIQGYKFNIFYPELIEKDKTPEYSLEVAEDPAYCIIKFTAGPPYEDIAFKIVNREWDYSDKKGFKCFFAREALTLHFNFKRNKYRR
ncbi:hypothetical protein IMG5_170650 [Ichthyophthirius multifiliis]|uniref:Splicing factor Cactin n=1 Tax=Ichthyophthirius multifiliis TaxID=5932 RepID=G0R1I0_ICHMU|nr:hypothetical protein IMG5_170650 [Ichthyophthirius multifiliis]EGR28681.1 hypothetical protein IMG5_170650 [Ichthyophthirius multifiliis]|eukprot:XP_004029917.1 hypothetical protein IMG5_170650 [Ichthyophthirius multifiliis]